jgi:hypothetical protein
VQKFPMWVSAEKDNKIIEGQIVITQCGVILEIPKEWNEFKGKQYFDFRNWIHDNYTIVQITEID